jgi:hypothetical protein
LLKNHGPDATDSHIDGFWKIETMISWLMRGECMMTFSEFEKLSVRACPILSQRRRLQRHHISVPFFWATVAVECFTPTPIIFLIKQPRFTLCK